MSRKLVLLLIICLFTTSAFSMNLEYVYGSDDPMVIDCEQPAPFCQESNQVVIEACGSQSSSELERADEKVLEAEFQNLIPKELGCSYGSHSVNLSIGDQSRTDTLEVDSGSETPHSGAHIYISEKDSKPVSIALKDDYSGSKTGSSIVLNQRNPATLDPRTWFQSESVKSIEVEEGTVFRPGEGFGNVECQGSGCNIIEQGFNSEEIEFDLKLNGQIPEDLSPVHRENVFDIEGEIINGRTPLHNQEGEMFKGTQEFFICREGATMENGMGEEIPQVVQAEKQLFRCDNSENKWVEISQCNSGLDHDGDNRVDHEDSFYHQELREEFPDRDCESPEDSKTDLKEREFEQENEVVDESNGFISRMRSIIPVAQTGTSDEGESYSSTFAVSAQETQDLNPDLCPAMVNDTGDGLIAQYNGEVTGGDGTDGEDCFYNEESLPEENPIQTGMELEIFYCYPDKEANEEEHSEHERRLEFCNDKIENGQLENQLETLKWSEPHMNSEKADYLPVVEYGIPPHQISEYIDDSPEWTGRHYFENGDSLGTTIYVHDSDDYDYVRGEEFDGGWTNTGFQTIVDAMRDYSTEGPVVVHFDSIVGEEEVDEEIGPCSNVEQVLLTGSGVLYKCHLWMHNSLAYIVNPSDYFHFEGSHLEEERWQDFEDYFETSHAGDASTPEVVSEEGDVTEPGVFSGGFYEGCKGNDVYKYDSGWYCEDGLEELAFNVYNFVIETANETLENHSAGLRLEGIEEWDLNYGDIDTGDLEMEAKCWAGSREQKPGNDDEALKMSATIGDLSETYYLVGELPEREDGVDDDYTCIYGFQQEVNTLNIESSGAPSPQQRLVEYNNGPEWIFYGTESEYWINTNAESTTGTPKIVEGMDIEGNIRTYDRTIRPHPSENHTEYLDDRTLDQYDNVEEVDSVFDSFPKTTIKEQDELGEDVGEGSATIEGFKAKDPAIETDNDQEEFQGGYNIRCFDGYCDHRFSYLGQ